MKKISLLALSLLATTGFAQTTLWNGEDVTCTADRLWGNSTKEVADNPDKTGINPSDKCIHFVMNGGNDGKVVKIPFREWMQPSMAGSRRVSLMIRKKKNENLQVELSDPTDGSAGYWHKVAAWYGGEGAWQKVVFDFSSNEAFTSPGVISITAQTSDDDIEGQEVWIDNIVIEPATTVNGKTPAETADASLTGNVVLAGAWMKGDCMNADNSPWTKYEYNDFDTLKTKMSADATSVDMTAAVLKDAYNAFGGNVLVYASAFADGENVVINGTAEKLHLNQDSPFNAPEGFTAKSITLEGSLGKGYAMMVLPFGVTAEELGAELATFDTASGLGADKIVSFAKTDAVDANMPMLINSHEAKNAIQLSGREISSTIQSPAYEAMKGTYAPQGAEGLWLVGADGTFGKGDSHATVKAFGAYIDMPEARSLTMNTGAGIDLTVLDHADAKYAYTLGGTRIRLTQSGSRLKSLPRGIYIVNGKKMVVK